MMGDNPFAKYVEAPPQAAPADGNPFSKYVAGSTGGNDITRTFSDVVPEIKTTASDAAGTINAGLNPVSDEMRGAHERAAKASFFDFGPTLESMKLTGKALASIPGLVSSPITGAARSLIGHPFAAVTGEPYEQAKGDVDTALMGLAPRGMSPVGPRTAPAPVPTAPELRTAARAGYNDPAVAAVQIVPQSTANLSASIRNDLLGQGFRPVQGQGANTMAILDELAPGPGVASVSVSDIDSARKALGLIAKERDATGRPTAEATAASRAINRVDDYLTGLTPGDVMAGDAQGAAEILGEARGNYGAAKRSEAVDTNLTRAERQAAKSGMGGNLENAYRQKVSQFLDNPNRSAGWSPDELAAAEEIVRGNFTRNSLRTIGKLGVDGGLSLLMHAATAYGTGGLSLPVAVIGTLARMSGESMTAGRANELAAMIRQRSPLAQSRPPVQEAMPGALPSAVVPQLLPQGLSLPMSFVPARARDDQDVSR